MAETQWHRPNEVLPEEEQEVEVITPGGTQRRLVFWRGLWWVPDRSMYVYFSPEFWRPA